MEAWRDHRPSTQWLLSQSCGPCRILEAIAGSAPPSACCPDGPDATGAAPALLTLMRFSCIKPSPVILIKSGIGFDPSRYRLDLSQVQSLSKRRCNTCATLRRNQSGTEGRKFRLVDHSQWLAEDTGAQFYKRVRTRSAAGREYRCRLGTRSQYLIKHPPGVESCSFKHGPDIYCRRQ
jgi:hypothetical protein